MKRIKDNRRTIRFLMPILAAFVVCVLPVNASDLYLAYHRLNIDFKVLRALTIIINICFPLHACVNPIMYTLVDRRFRNELLDLLGFSSAKNRASAQVISNTGSTAL